MKHPGQNKICIICFTLMFVFSLSGCVSTGREKKSITIKPAKFEQVQSTINQAILVTQAAKTGGLPSLPFVNINTNAKIKIDKKPQIDVYSEQPVSILQYNINPDGVANLVLLNESTGRYGRIDRRLETIVYKTSKPDAAQVKSIKTWLLKQKSTSMAKGKSSNKQIVIDFQKERGLSPDGQFGPLTAKALASDFSMLHVNSLESSSVYPEFPNHMAFLLPNDIFKKEYSKLPKGFESWLKISKLSISKEKFKEIAEKGQKYILLVYFFDRVDPSFGINVEFAAKEEARGNAGSGKPYHVNPGAWPVIAKAFTIDDVPDNLYVNIFIQKSTYSNPCVGSHKLL